MGVAVLKGYNEPGILILRSAMIKHKTSSSLGAL